MKKYQFFYLLLAICSACNNMEFQENKDNNHQHLNIKLNVQTENVDMSYEPLRSASEDKTFAINVYQMNPNTNNYEYYCCGVFDNADNLSISFQKGYKYKLHIAMFIDYFNHYNFTIDNNKQQSSTRLTSASNSFQYESSYIYDLDCNYYLLADKEYTRAIRPNIDSFHAIKEDYEPLENESLSVTLKRSSFGIGVNIEGMDEGTINATLRTQKYYNYAQPEFNITYPNNTYSEIFTMFNPFSEFDTMDICIKYTNSNGEITELINEENFKFSKNVRTIFNIKINKNNDINTNSNISINIDNTEFTETTHNYNCSVN